MLKNLGILWVSATFFHNIFISDLLKKILAGQHCQVNNWCIPTFLDIYWIKPDKSVSHFRNTVGASRTPQNTEITNGKIWTWFLCFTLFSFLLHAFYVVTTGSSAFLSVSSTPPGRAAGTAAAAC